ncbi:hypothetical protein GXP70_04700 [Paenibacillus lycopersici]|uniref:Reverse transcriptase domain-containing protein n=1 Tax=Paenibacillus lycopersici TaxID=2704462 RepID=A0A6C0FR37_9BACL|nr:hypothetical protein [Paenibacillus lycopersici]QHT59337.1 hypothetical protein GXP70_04700 [Paenibacillus lycopersici]
MNLSKGIPQGTAISEVLANVYAIEFDEVINTYVTGLGGIYRRYSDDIIVVIPIKAGESDNISDHISFIKEAVMQNKIEMGAGKTSTLFYFKKGIHKPDLLLPARTGTWMIFLGHDGFTKESQLVQED